MTQKCTEYIFSDPQSVRSTDILSRSATHIHGLINYTYDSDESQCDQFRIDYTCDKITMNTTINKTELATSFDLTGLTPDCEYELNFTAVSNRNGTLKSSEVPSTKEEWTSK